MYIWYHPIPNYLFLCLQFIISFINVIMKCSISTTILMSNVNNQVRISNQLAHQWLIQCCDTLTCLPSWCKKICCYCVGQLQWTLLMCWTFHRRSKVWSSTCQRSPQKMHFQTANLKVMSNKFLRCSLQIWKSNFCWEWYNATQSKNVINSFLCFVLPDE